MLYLFDIDGTLLLSGGAGTRAINQLFEERYQLTGAMDDVHPGGKTDPGIFTEIFTARLGRPPSPDELDSIIDAYVPLLTRELAESPRFRLMPAVFETLDFLGDRPEVILGIATGNVRGGAEAKLARAGLSGRFSFGGFGDDSSDRPSLVALAVARGCDLAGRAVAADQIVVVGDTPLDIAAARACGVRVVTVATGPADQDALVAAEPDALLATLAELPDWHRSEYLAA